MCNALVLDIGGTKIRLGLCGQNQDVLAEVATPQNQSDIAPCLRSLVDTYRVKHTTKIDHLVIGCPGLIDKSGRVTASLYWPATGLNLRDIFHDTGMKIFVLNDANLQALGIAEEIKNGFYLAFGTGVGGSVILDGKLVLGESGFAGEFGHVAICNNDEPCLCGSKGCFDTIASGYWLEKNYGASWWNLMSNSDLTSLMTNIAKAAAQIVSPYGRLLDIGTVVFAGHITQSKDFQVELRKALHRDRCTVNCKFEPNTWPLAVRGAQVLTGTS